MKNLLSVFLYLLICTLCRGELLAPDQVVTTLVQSAHDDKLTRFLLTADIPAIASQPRHSFNQMELLKFLKTIDPKKIAYQTKDNAAGIKWFESSPGRVLVRMIKPIRMDFELETRKPAAGGDQFFCVISIHP